MQKKLTDFDVFTVPNPGNEKECEDYEFNRKQAEGAKVYFSQVLFQNYNM